MLGNNHGFFDPNVWYNEDELRKQVETFARCIVITGQEAPESAKKLHLDLFKKTMSGDGIAGSQAIRVHHEDVPPHWLEEVGNQSDASVRRNHCCQFQFHLPERIVVASKGPFPHPPHVLATLHADHELDGHFAADPSLKQFLSSLPSAAAGLRLQHAFEAVTGKQDCLDLIEELCVWR